MFTVIQTSFIRFEKAKASLAHKNEWSFNSVHSDKNRLVRNTVFEDIGLSD